MSTKCLQVEFARALIALTLLRPIFRWVARTYTRSMLSGARHVTCRLVSISQLMQEQGIRLVSGERGHKLGVWGEGGRSRCGKLDPMAASGAVVPPLQNALADGLRG